MDNDEINVIIFILAVFILGFGVGGLVIGWYTNTLFIDPAFIDCPYIRDNLTTCNQALEYCQQKQAYETYKKNEV